MYKIRYGSKYRIKILKKSTLKYTIEYSLVLLNEKGILRKVFCTSLGITLTEWCGRCGTEGVLAPSRDRGLIGCF